MSLSSRVDLCGQALVCRAVQSAGESNGCVPVGGRAADCDRVTLRLFAEAFLPRVARAARLGAAGPGAAGHGCDRLAGAELAASLATSHSLTQVPGCLNRQRRFFLQCAQTPTLTEAPLVARVRRKPIGRVQSNRRAEAAGAASLENVKL
jgi:hypothetical protein